MSTAKKKSPSNLLNDYHLLSFDALDSTNEEAKRLAKGGGCHGAVIWAKRQTAGKGRLGREWASPEGNLFVSILLHPQKELRQCAELSFVTAVAVIEAVEALVPQGNRLQCKWPNDILLNDHKLGGILLESFRAGEEGHNWTVVGVGVNVDSHPSKTEFPAACLKEAGVELVSAKIILSRFIHHFIERYNEWNTKGFAPARKEWLKHAWGMGKRVSARMPDGNIEGIASEIDSNGSLVLTLDNGKKQHILAADIFPAEPKEKERLTMLLAIDAGNTNFVFAVFDGKKLLGQWRLHTDARRTADEYGVWLTQVLEHAGIQSKKITGAILSSVVPQALFELRQLTKRYFHTDLLVIGDPRLKIKLGIGVKIDNPAEVGADRLVNAFAAWRKYKQAMIVVDFGTATTFDVISAKGDYIGGVIAPGVNLSLDALQRAAAKLPNVAIQPPAKVIGTNTVGAMQSGIYYGYIGLVEGIAARIQKDYGKPMKVIATGGLAALYAKSCPVIERVEPDLTILGLKELYEMNT